MPSIVRVLKDGSMISAGAKWGDDGYLSLIQDPEATSILNVDWTGFLDGEAITTSVWEAQNLTLTSSAVSGASTAVYVSATPKGTTGQAKVTLTTSNNRIIVRRFKYYGFDQ